MIIEDQMPEGNNNNMHVWVLESDPRKVRPWRMAEHNQVGAGDPHRLHASVHSFQLVKDPIWAKFQARHVELGPAIASPVNRIAEQAGNLTLGSPLGRLHDKLQRRKQGWLAGRSVV